MARYKYVDVMYEGQYPIHYGLILMEEVMRMENPAQLAAILEERYPDRIVAVDVWDSDILQALPSNTEQYEVALKFLNSVNAYAFKGKWKDGEV
ncbi:hypothetical protein ACFP2F_21765 [Hymenobacter artigasi]|uniref:Uncharacterized protein n=1 Tax=Hymenobacter artigasi TaxID=2719616 RepID=A0ABX1HR61_9BACT|nr:hypothetical protein [Hymenobacter artigasi]NKI91877.1 hypothetical protein [Hymenobacter artigasi]